MSEQDNLQVAEKWIEAVNAHDFGAWEEMRSPEYLWEGPGMPGPAGADAEVTYMEGAYQAFPDLHIEVVQTIAQGDLVVVNGLIVGTNQGSMTMPDGQTLPATGKKWNIPFSETLEFADGKILHRSMYSDRMEQMAQLGLSPGA